MAVNSVFKRVASKLPRTWQNELKRLQFRHEIRKGNFLTDEREFAMLDQWVSEGDWVIDIGANIGHYTVRLSSLVGPSGRVLAFEPVPETFELLAANVARAPNQNVTLLNAAASDSTATVGMSIPSFDTGLKNFYMAHVTAGQGELQIMTLAVDSLAIANRVSMVKIDAEGHEMAVLEGMKDLLQRDRPVLVVEDSSEEIGRFLAPYGYHGRREAGSSNLIFSASSTPEQAHSDSKC